MTFEGETKPGEPDLYLFTKLTLQELRDDDTAPETPAKPKPVAEEKAPTPKPQEGK